MNVYDLIIFDCDGTLVDTEYLNNLALCELLSDQGLTQYDMAYAYKHFVGRRFYKILEGISQDTGHIFPEDMAKHYVERARALIPTHMKNIDGAGALVQAAKDHGKICVASNGQRDNVIYSLEQAGLLKYFQDDWIFAGTQVENPKPAPDIFLMAAAYMDVRPERCLVIEDSLTGITAGLAANMDVWGFTGTHDDPESYKKVLERSGIDTIHHSLIHIRETLWG